jgi:hypothetical protein
MAGSTDIMGSVVGMVMSYIQQGLSKDSAEKAYKEFANSIPAVDPMQVKFKDQLMAEKRAVQSGFSTEFKAGRDIISQTEAGNMSVASELARTSPALALMAMNQASMQSQMGTNKLLGTQGTQVMGYNQQISDLINTIAQRRADTNVLKATQKYAMTTKINEQTNEQTMGWISQLTGGMGSSGGNGGGSLNDLISQIFSQIRAGGGSGSSGGGGRFVNTDYSSKYVDLF